MGTQPVEMLKRVVDQIANILETVQGEQERRGGGVVVNVLHPLNEGQQSIVTEQDSEIRDWVGQVADALGSRVTTTLQKVPNENLGEVLNDLLLQPYIKKGVSFGE